MSGDLLRSILSPRVVVSWFMATLAMAVTGPLGTYSQFSLLGGMAYWGLVMAIVATVLTLTLYLEGRWWRSYPFWPRMLMAMAAFTLVFAPIQWGVMVAVRGYAISLGRLIVIAALVPATVWLIKCLWLGPEVVWPHTPERQPRLLDRLAPELRAAPLHLSVNDHYVVVLTERGRAHLLMRFSDAMAELEGVEGMQVHRSHWVARAAVIGSGRRNGKLFLVLVDGSEVPVSRGHQQEVIDSGYVDEGGGARRPDGPLPV